MSAPFARLSPAMQYQIVNGLGFRELRPVQEQTIGPVLDGNNCVVLAPTAGGKTEAALFPLLSQMDTEDWRPVSVIYVAPIRALLNNQEARIERYAQLVGRRAFKWHGDVSASARKAFINNPSDILLTTPESLEVMMMSRHVPAQRLFRGLRAVVIDEIHAFVGDDRGGHLSALLERLSRFCGSDVQRIGLSATVGNPDAILGWVAGSSARQGTVVRATAPSRPPDLSLDFVGSHENAARVITALHPGKKRLVFVDSRRGVESVGRALIEQGVDAYVIHSSLSLDERERAERAFAEGKSCVIVATSALELGIDIGDLDHVLQVGCPTTVAAFLQRLGRSGRRADTCANCTFLALGDEDLVQAAALLRLYQKGYVEPVRFVRRAPHLLAHQLMALCLQEQGIARADWWAWIQQATPFADITFEDRKELVDHMLAEDILATDGTRLMLGDRGEKLYGFRNFAELYAVFSAPRTFTVLHGSTDLGTLEVGFLEDEEPGRLTFTLGARTWRVMSIDWTNGLVHVLPAPEAHHARWRGRPVLLHRELCQAIRGVLTSSDADPWWSRRAREKLATIRAEHAFLLDGDSPLVGEATGYRWWNFAGGRANNLLARVLEEQLGEKVTRDNYSIGLKAEAAKSEVAIRRTLDELRATGRPNAEDALRLASSCFKARLSKFEPCLTDRLRSVQAAGVLLLEAHCNT